MATVSSLFVKIGADNRGLVAGLAQSSAAVKGFGASTSASLGQAARSTQGAASGFAKFSTGVQSGLSRIDGQVRSVIGVGLPAALGFAAVAATKMALDFENTFTRIRSLSNASADDIGRWRDQVLSLSGSTARSPQELGEALFFLSSAGLKANEIMPALAASARAAATGMGETSDVANIVSSALNAYADSGLTATRVTDTLAAAIREGRAEPDAFAEAIGRALPIASQAGVTFQDLSASLAVLTNIGLDVPEAVTAIRGAIQALAAPGPQAAQALDQLGISAQDLLDAVSADGLIGALRLLDQQARKNTTTQADYIGVLRKVIPNIRSITGAIGILGQDTDKVDGIFNRVTNSTGSLGDAFREWAAGPGAAFSKAFAQIRLLMIRVGEVILAVTRPIAQLLTPVLKVAADNATLLFTALLAFTALRFLPTLLTNIGMALAEAGFAEAAAKVGTLAANLEALTPFVAAGTALAVTFGILAHTLGNIHAENVARASATIRKFGSDSARSAGAVRTLSREIAIENGISFRLPQTTERLAENRAEIQRRIAALDAQHKAQRIASTDLNEFGRQLDDIRGPAKNATSALDGLQGVASITGQSFADLEADTRAALAAGAKDVGKWRDFVASEMGKAAQAIDQWKQQTADSLNFIGVAFDELANHPQATTEQITRFFDDALEQERSFIQNIRTILRDGTEGARLLVQQLLAGGPAAQRQAEQLAAAPKGVRKEWEKTAAQMQSLADKTANSLSKQIVGTLQDIRGILKSIAQAFGIEVKTDDHGSRRTLDQIRGKLHDVTTPDWVVRLETKANTAALTNLKNQLAGLPSQKIITIVTQHRDIHSQHSGGLIMHAGGAVYRMHSGGLKSDERTAILQTGEFVMRRSAVNAIGLPTLQRLNRMHSGGSVAITTGGGSDDRLLNEIQKLRADLRELDVQGDVIMDGAKVGKKVARHVTREQRREGDLRGHVV